MKKATFTLSKVEWYIWYWKIVNEIANQFYVVLSIALTCNSTNHDGRIKRRKNFALNDAALSPDCAQILMFRKALRYDASHINFNTHRGILARQLLTQKIAYFSDWLFHFIYARAATIAIYEPAIMFVFLACALFLPSFSLRTYEYYMRNAYAFAWKKYLRDLHPRLGGRLDLCLKAVSKIYAFRVELMRFTSLGEPYANSSAARSITSGMINVCMVPQ